MNIFRKYIQFNQFLCIVLALHMFKVCLDTSASKYGVISHKYLFDDVKNIICMLLPSGYISEQDDQEEPTEQNSVNSEMSQLYQLCAAEPPQSHLINLEETHVDSAFLYKLLNEPSHVQEIISPPPKSLFVA